MIFGKTSKQGHIILLNILLGLGVFFFIGARHTTIGFHGDDYGLIWNGRYSSFKDVVNIFKNGDIMHNSSFDKEDNLYPPCESFRNDRPSFLEVIYRPLLIFIMATEDKLFGLNAYPGHLIHSFLHTVAALVIFNIVASFTQPLLAAFCTLFFAFHTSLKDYFFWQCYIQGSFELFCFILILFFSFKASSTKKTLFICLSLLFFLLALLTRETLLFLPGIPLIGAYFYRNELREKQFFTIQKIFTSLSIMALPIFIYFGTRMWAYPLCFNAKRIGIRDLSKNESISLYLKNKFYDLITYFFDLFGMKEIPCGFTVLKIGILFFIGGGLFYLWKQSSHKKMLLLLASATLILSWPSILFFHSSRYLYLPVFCLSIFIGLLLQSLMQKQITKIISLVLMGIYVTVQASITIPTLKAWSCATGSEQKIRQQLAALSAQYTDIIALGCPHRLMGMAHGMSHKLFNGNPKANTRYTLCCHTVYDGTKIEPLRYTHSNNQLIITSTSKKSVWFKPEALLDLDWLGKITILNEEDDRIYEIQIDLHSDIEKKHLLLWNMETEIFDHITSQKTDMDIE